MSQKLGDYKRHLIPEEKKLQKLGLKKDGAYIKENNTVIMRSPITLLPWAAKSLSEASQFIYDITGKTLRFHWGYRSISEQYCLFKRALLHHKNFQKAIKRVAPAYHSEHHTGLAIDIQNLYPEANKYLPLWGWELSYPLNQSIGTIHEPWHFRFIGKKVIAKAMAGENLDPQLAKIAKTNESTYADVDNSHVFHVGSTAASEAPDFSVFLYLFLKEKQTGDYQDFEGCFSRFVRLIRNRDIEQINSLDQLHCALEHLLTLIPGDKSPEVLSLQGSLAKFGLFRVTPTGYFGSITKESVRNANKLFNLPAVDVATPILRSKLPQCLIRPLEVFTPEQLALITQGEWKTNISGNLRFFQLQDSRHLFQPALNDLIILVGREDRINSQLRRYYQKGERATLMITRNQKLRDPQNYNILEVDNSVWAAGRLAKSIRGEQSSKLIAVTGSSGKTTLVRMIGEVFSTQRKMFGHAGWNSLLGNVCAVANNPEGADVIITECGLGAGWSPLATMSPIIQPDIVVVTSIDSAHIAGYKNIANLTSAKLQLANNLKAGGALIVDGDSPQLSQFLSYAEEKQIAKVITVGERHGNMFRTCDYTFNGGSSRFRLLYRGNSQDVVIPLLGRHKVKLAGFALACSYLLGLDTAEVIKDFRRVRVVPGRGNLIGSLGNGLAIFDSHYNANPGSMRADLEAYASVCSSCDSARIGVIGAMKELGDSAEDFHQSLLPLIQSIRFRHIMFTGEEAKGLCEKAGGFTSVSFHQDSTEVLDVLKKNITGNELIFIKGSNANNLNVVVEGIKKMMRRS